MESQNAKVLVPESTSVACSGMWKGRKDRIVGRWSQSLGRNRRPLNLKKDQRSTSKKRLRQNRQPVKLADIYGDRREPPLPFSDGSCTPVLVASLFLRLISGRMVTRQTQSADPRAVRSPIITVTSYFVSLRPRESSAIENTYISS